MAALVQKLIPLGPSINRRRLLSLYRNANANSALLQQHTGWQPAGALLERLPREAERRVPADQMSVNHQGPVS
jgi:hypothetical protein